MRGVVLETAYVDGATGVWQRAVAARRAFLATSATRMQRLRDEGHLAAINRTVQVPSAVLAARPFLNLYLST